VNFRKAIGDLIKTSLHNLEIRGKTGQKILQPRLVEALNNAGYQADKEDGGVFLSPFMPVWRSKETNEIEKTKARRKIDIVVRSAGRPVALIETESDLNDLNPLRVTRRNGHYDVVSIAKSNDGEHFESYKSLERMAAAAHYFYLREVTQRTLTTHELVTRLESIRSDSPTDHNPSQISLFLVTGSSRERDKEILSRRLFSLNAELISAVYK
jgi:hypothetical protein